MSKLLRASFRRYFKSFSFWLCFAFLLLLGLFGCMDIGQDYLFDDIFLISFPFVFAVMIPLVLMKEYGGGVFRNKIICGYTRSAIFFSEMITALTLCFSMLVLCSLTALLFNGNIFFDEIPKGVLIRTAIGFILLNLAVAVLCVTLCCLIQHKAVSAIASLILVIGMLFGSIILRGELQRPKYLDTVVTEIDGKTVEKGQQLNPNYVDGVQRVIYQFVYDTIPFGQILEYSEILSPYFSLYEIKLTVPENEMATLNSAPLYSLGLILAVGGGGYIIFKKKNFK